jgi:hypothetical protein
MKTVILIYETDCWHSRSSMCLVAVATTETQRDKLIRKYVRQKGGNASLARETVEQVRENGQTSHLDDALGIEIYTEPTDTNTLL